MKKITNFPLAILILSSCCFSCKNDGGRTGISDFFKKEVIEISALNAQLNVDSFSSIYDIVGADSSFSPADFSTLYSARESIWFDQYGLNENGKGLLAQLKLANTEGLEPNDYNVSTLDSILGNLETLNVEQIKDAEFQMSYSFLKFSHDLLLGKVAPLKINKNWQNKNDTTWSVDSMSVMLRQQSVNDVLAKMRPAHPWYKKFRKSAIKLQQLSQYRIERSALPNSLNIGDSSSKVQTLRGILANVADTSLDKNSMIWDQDAVNALQTYQTEYGINSTGQFDSVTVASFTQKSDENIKQLGMNMERMRWLQKDFADEFIWVNIPQMEVRYFEGDDITFQMNAVVGRTSRKTPTLDSKMSNIVFNPPWFVPPTILKQEIIPGIARRGGSYLSRRGLVARDRRGRKVNPSRINSKNYRRYSISQNPGRNSALGSVKFNFPNKEAIFLHDTNHRGGFTRKYRASSSGCIRVHHPKDFARFLLRDSTYSAKGIDSIIKRRSTKSVKIDREIGVHLVYLTNAVDSSGRVIKVNDIYKWDKKLAAHL